MSRRNCALHHIFILRRSMIDWGDVRQAARRTVPPNGDGFKVK